MSINARGPINQQESAYNEAMSLLRKDDIFSERKKRITTIIESGEGSIQSRDRITEIIANLDINGTTINNLAATNDSFKARLTSLGTLEEKIAYIISLNFIRLPITQRGAIPQVNATNVKTLMVTYLNVIEEESNKWTNYSQKFIIRHAALNRFNPELTPEEQEKLDGIILDLKGIISKEKLNYSFHLGQETDAQKIMKVSEIIRLIRCANINTKSREDLDKINKDFKELRGRLSELDNLDKTYSNLSAALNSFYTNNRNVVRPEGLFADMRDSLNIRQRGSRLNVRAKSAMIAGSTDIRRLRIALGVLKNDSNLNIDNYVSSLLENCTIDINATLEEILTGKEIEGALKKSNLTKEHFIRLFLEYISQELVILAKHKLDLQKKKVFKNSTKDFENDINTQKEIQRRKIIEIGGRNIVRRENIVILTSYLRSNKHVFRLTDNPTNDQRIANDNNSIRRALEVAILDICPNTCLVDRNALRDSILTQNQHINELFHGDNNPFIRKQATKGLRHSTLNHIRRVSDHTSVLSKKYGQATSKVVLGGLVVAAATASVWAGTILTGLAVAAGVKLGAKGMSLGGAKFNSWVNKDRKGWRNFMFMPLKAAKFVTVPLEKIGYGIDAGSSKVIDTIGKTRKKVNSLISGKIKDAKWVKELTGDEVNNLFSLIALGLNGTIRLTAEGASLLTKISLDAIDTGEKRRILEGIYSSRNAQNLREFAEQVEIQNLIQEDVGLFNKDGYVENIETNGENSEAEKETPEVPEETRPAPEETQEKDGDTKNTDPDTSGEDKEAETKDKVTSIRKDDIAKRIEEDQEKINGVVESLESSKDGGNLNLKEERMEQLKDLSDRLSSIQKRIKIKTDQIEVNKKTGMAYHNKWIESDLEILTKEEEEIRSEIEQLEAEIIAENESKNKELEDLRKEYSKIEYEIKIRIEQMKINRSNGAKGLNRLIREDLRKITKEEKKLRSEIERLGGTIK